MALRTDSSRLSPDRVSSRWVFWWNLRASFHPLHRLRRLGMFRVVAAVLDWPVSVRLRGISHPVRLRLMRNLGYVWYRMLAEPELIALITAINKLFRPGQFWDVGANVGYLSWLLKSQSAGMTVALFEPDPINVALLQATLKKSTQDGITIFTSAVSNRNGKSVFAVDQISGATGTLRAEDSSFVTRHYGVQPESIHVETITLDTVRQKTPTVDLIKIDVEGQEGAVIEGAMETIRSDRPILIFECFEGIEKIIPSLEELGYLLFDAERLNDSTLMDLTGETTNFLALPGKYAEQRERLALAWREELRTFRLTSSPADPT